MPDQIEVIVSVPTISVTVELPLKIVSDGGECPVIDVIDGGTASSSFGPINGNLDGGGA